MANGPRASADTSQGLARHMPVASFYGRAPEGAILPDARHDADTIAVVYAKGDTPPRITVSQMEGNLQMVLADGVAVAIVSNRPDRRLAPEDVLLVERFVASN